MIPPLVQLAPVTPCPLHVASCEDRASVLFVVPFKYWKTVMRSPQAASSPERKFLQSVLTVQVLKSFYHLCGPSLDPSLVYPHLS